MKFLFLILLAGLNHARDAQCNANCCTNCLKKPTYIDCDTPDFDDDWALYRKMLEHDHHEIISAIPDMTSELIKKYSSRMPLVSHMEAIIHGRKPASALHSFCPIGMVTALLHEYISQGPAKYQNVIFAYIPCKNVYK